MKREFTVMGICAAGLFVVIAYIPNFRFARELVVLFELGVIWSFFSAFRKG